MIIPTVSVLQNFDVWVLWHERVWDDDPGGILRVARWDVQDEGVVSWDGWDVVEHFGDSWLVRYEGKKGGRACALPQMLRRHPPPSPPAQATP
jgi:hypothetical protein